MDIYEELVKLRNERRACALVTIVQSTGSAPQKEGAKMLVRDDGSIAGTLGGGCLEAGSIQAAIMAMKDGAPSTLPFTLTEDNGGLVCGGKVLVYIEPFIPEPRLIILGAGHVGRALSFAGNFSGFRVVVIDDREEFANTQNMPHAHEIAVHGFESAFESVIIDHDCYIVIATRGHNHDLEGVKAALSTSARYIGLVGSKRKKALLTRTLKDSGFAEAEIRRINTPVGLQIGSVTPEEIAISIMAQIIQQRRCRAAPRVGHSSCGWNVEENGTIKATSSG